MANPSALTRSMDRSVRYFLAKRAEGPALIVAERIIASFNQLKGEGRLGQFHPICLNSSKFAH